MIDEDKLRYDLMNYFGTAMSSGFSMAVMDLSEVEIASLDRLMEIAKENGFSLEDYKLEEDNKLKY